MGTGASAGTAAAIGATAALAPAIPALILRSKKVRQILAKLSTMGTKHPDYDTVAADATAAITAAMAAQGATQ